MRILITFTLVLLCYTQGCPVYQCDKINNNGRSGDEIICGQRVSDSQYNVDDDCESGYTCEAGILDIFFGTLPQVAYCQPIGTPWYETRYPGDICELDSQCFMNATCQSGVCVAANPNIGAPCTYSGECSTRQYCNQDLYLCEPVLQVGQSCTGSNQCGWGIGCLPNIDGSKSYCTSYLSLPVGTVVYNSSSSALFCETENTVVVGNQRYCSPGDISITGPSVGLQLDEKCFYKHYNDPNDWSSFVVTSDKPFCGYNQDDSAYCNQRNGDHVYTSYLSTLKDAYSSDLDCNYYSDEHYHYITDFDCADFIKKYGTSFSKTHVQAEFLVQY